MTIPDPTTALLLTHFDAAERGRVRRDDLRRRQHRFNAAARLRKLLA